MRRIRSSLRNSFIATIAVLGAAALVAIVVVLQVVVVGGFANLEQSDAASKLRLAAVSVDRQARALGDRIVGNAYWDDSYTFIEDHNQEYIDSVLLNGGLAPMGADIVAYVDAGGALVWGGAIDLASGEDLPYTDAFSALIGPGSRLLAHEDLAASNVTLAQLPKGLAVVASRPILTSSAEGPSHGSIVAARYIDATLMADLAEATGEAVEVLPLDGAVPAAATAAQRGLTPAAPDAAVPVDEASLVALHLLADAEGTPVGLIRLDLARTIHAQGNGVMVASLVLSGLAGVLILAVILVLIERLVGRDLERLARAAERVANGETSVEIAGTERIDEVGRVANGFAAVVRYLDEAADVAESDLAL